MTSGINPFYTRQRTSKNRGIFRGTQADELIKATPLNNVILGLEGNDTIKAGAGDDILFGGTGNDLLYGGEGNDVINGGAGNDTLIGGSGADKFFINRGFSVIEDFRLADDDSFELGRFLSNVTYEQDGSNVLVKSDQGLTIILNTEVNAFV